ncbi:MAG TPA: hypothetical protein VJW55_17090 [Candidatus Angelobacter sp.]|nr:hypothetical protein [Candidatus Angelobacter sp.]
MVKHINCHARQRRRAAASVTSRASLAAAAGKNRYRKLKASKRQTNPRAAMSEWEKDQGGTDRFGASSPSVMEMSKKITIPA